MKIGDLFAITKGKKPPELFDQPTESSIPFIKIEAIRTVGSHQYCDPSTDLVVCEPNDVLVVWDGAYSGLTGFGLQGAIGSTIARLKAKTQTVFGPYAGHFLRTRFSEIQKNATGAAIPHVNGRHLRSLEIPLPPLDEQKRISAVLDKADALRRQRKNSLELTEKLLQSVFISMFGDPVKNPKGWPMLELGRFGIVQTGNTPPRSNKENYASEGLEWIKTDNIVEDRVIVTSAVEKLSPAGARMARVVPKDSLLVACIAGSEKSIGRAALTDRTVAFNQQINAITPHADVSPLFLYFLMKIARRQVQLAAGKGMKKMINKSTFEGLRFIAPDEEHQRAFEKLAQRIIQQSQDCRDQLPVLESLFTSLQQRAFRAELDLSRLVLDRSDDTPSAVAPSKPVTKPSKQKAAPRFLIAPAPLEQNLKKLDRIVSKGDPIPWSADYFKYRILASQPTPFSFTDIMQKAEIVFEQPLPPDAYENVRDLFFDLLGQDEKTALLRQRFDLQTDEQTNEVTGRKEMVFEPAP